jgi:hypothetical protein
VSSLSPDDNVTVTATADTTSTHGGATTCLRLRGQPPRRHGIFYYVFWGTISLFVTLAILFVGFVFLTGAGAAFLVGLSHHRATTRTAATQNLPALATTRTAATQNLPALTETEIEQARSLVTG